MPAPHRVLRGRHAARDLRPGLLELAHEEGDALLEDAVVLLEAQDLAAQPAQLGAQRLDAGELVQDRVWSAHAFLRAVISSCAAQAISRFVPGSPGRCTKA